MKKIIRLTESDLIRLVRRVINEQTDNVKPLSNQSKGLEIGDLTYKLPQLKDEESISRFTWPSNNFGKYSHKDFLKNVFGENSENFKSSLSTKPKTISNQIFSVVEVLLTLNAITGESSPITLEKAKNLLKTIDYNALSVYNPDYDTLDSFSNGVDFLVKYKFDSDVFKYYSTLLQSRITK